MCNGEVCAKVSREVMVHSHWRQTVSGDHPKAVLHRDFHSERRLPLPHRERQRPRSECACNELGKSQHVRHTTASL